ncbi:hypothetical protein HZS_7910 [Henneguya salminicola]|nr:hypothetical protein HZS_7910 [Henneguya salminicola]
MSSVHAIQALAIAERKATDLINEAKKKKTLRIKLAKDEAAAEIERFKNDCEEQYREKLRDQEDGNALKTFVEQHKAKVLAQMNENVDKNKDSAIADIIECVKIIEPKIHINFER